ncbi:hypothetical protein [Hanstruepera marina]|uniref:hypothetical protein n=1 Tax=Hanstruepera marina TaxID=2873265 RepID=UPI001CA69776|nr:hypothetical protein [Hanstruepera marina]
MSKIWNAYKYIYYRLYSFSKNKIGERELAPYSAMFLMSFSSLVILFIINVSLIIFLNIEIITSNNVSIIEVVIIALVLLAIHFFLFIPNKKYLKIENEFVNESKKLRFRNGVFVLFYPIGSLVIYAILLFYLASINSI